MEIARDSVEISDLCFDSNFRIPFSGKLNFEFGNYSNCLSHSPEIIESLKSDCQIAFDSSNAQDNDDVSSVVSNEYHNSGSTYFQRSDQEPRCSLEALALSIFNFHTKDATFRRDISGAEWWTQVVDSGDDIGFHWDKDYGLEGSKGVNVYPHLATVTYLTDIGGPTIIVNSVGCLHSEDPYSGVSESVIMSKPILGKHIKFDGRLLHAAPSSLIFGKTNDNDSIPPHFQEKKKDCDNQKKIYQENPLFIGKRITFLVNIWINHVPLQSKKIPDEMIEKFSLLRPASDLSFFHEKTFGNTIHKKTISQIDRKSNICEMKRFSDDLKFEKIEVPLVRISSEILQGTLDLHRWNFVNGGFKYLVSIPFPSTKRIIELLKMYNAFNFNYYNSGVDAVVDCLDDKNNNLSSEKAKKRRKKFWRPYHLQI